MGLPPRPPRPGTPSARRRARRAARPALETLEGRVTPTTVPAGFSDVALTSGITNPTAMEIGPGNRVFALEQSGAVVLVRADGTLWTALQLNVDSQRERGLLGIAFDPGFVQNHYAYLYYTNPNAGPAPWASGAHNQISRFTVDDTTPQAPVFTNETPILDLDLLGTVTSHNGGAIHFGADGMLYAGVGDGVQSFTQGGQTYRVSQTLDSLLGKQLRIDVGAFNAGRAIRDDTTVGHLIPADNPFVGTATGINQLIYALGLRNPFTFAVEPNTGRIYVNDVGESTWEEIDRMLPGGNYGWGAGNTDGFGQTPPGPGVYHDPLLAYNHQGGPAGGGAGIVGGVFYDPAYSQFPPSFVGKYLYGDLAAGWVRVFDPSRPGGGADPDTSTSFATDVAGGIRDLKVDARGNLYVLSGAGTVEKVSFTANAQAPRILTQPQGATVALGRAAELNVAASGSATLVYQWQRRVGAAWVDIGQNSPRLSFAGVTAADAGDYRVVAANPFGYALSGVAALNIATNLPPVATITTPTPGAHYNWGQTVTFSGAATDPEDGSLPAGRLTWLVYYVRLDAPNGTGLQTRLIQRVDGASGGSFAAAVYDTTPLAWYRVYLVTSDSQGAVAVAFRDVMPNSVRLTVATSRPGLLLGLDGRVVPSGTTVTSIVGLPHSANAFGPQAYQGRSYAFASWSNGGPALQTWIAPASDATLTATYITRTSLTAARPAATSGRARI